MKAWRIGKHGGPEVQERVELPVPAPGPMQARVRVEALGLNHMDVWARNGVPGYKYPLPMIPGCDVAGAIDAFGPGAEAALAPDRLAVGSAVIVNPAFSCGHCEACLGGFDPLCPRFGLLGETADGGAADFVNVPVANLVARPPSLTAAQGAALPIQFVTAWSMLTRKAQVRAGETVLIQAGGSGVSVAAIQMAKLLGAYVITTVGSDDKVAKALALGADHAINYRKGPFRDEVRKILAAHGKKGVEVALDHVGADTFGETLRCLGWGGRLVTCGATSGAKVELDLKHVFFKNISILGSTMGSKADLIRIVGLVAGGKLKPVIDSTFPMEKYPEAVSRLEGRGIFGKVVVTA